MTERFHRTKEEGRTPERRGVYAVSGRLALRASLGTVLLLSTALVVYVTVQDTRAAKKVAEKALAGTALALSAAAERALHQGNGTDEMRSILSDRIVAYALITGPDGVIRFHTNRALVGTRVAEVHADTANDERVEASGRRIRLGTGVPAYEFRHELHEAGREREILWLVLHTTPIDDVASRSRRLDWGVGGMIALLWVAGLGLDRLGGHLIRLREEIGRKERLSLVGQMTATLSHEIRNAIGGVKGYAQWIDEQTAAEDPRKKGLGLILRNTGRIETLVDQLLRFSRQETYHVAAVELRQAIAESVRSTVAAWPGEVRVQVEDGSEVRADPEKLNRVLINGVRNALDAMPGGGTLTIRARHDRRKQVVITITDTGRGLDDAAAARVFTPFFTTKADGTGLGLAYSRKVLEEMGGSIALHNGPAGAILSITLPSA